ncbi:hypothetical protein GCM10027168_41560 [Streptomyces capparidis]
MHTPLMVCRSVQVRPPSSEPQKTVPLARASRRDVCVYAPEPVTPAQRPGAALPEDSGGDALPCRVASPRAGIQAPGRQPEAMPSAGIAGAADHLLP